MPKNKKTKDKKMADIEKLVPFILKWETGARQKKGETAQELFERSRARGFSNDAADLGGATQSGVTLAAYRSYKGNLKLTADDLKKITWEDWLGLLRKDYWNRWQADKIQSQSIADMLVDWVWASGSYGITRVQKLLGVKVDGIVGKVTLQALNSRSPLPLWAAIRKDRLRFIDEICNARPANRKFRQGWLNRINDLKYSE